MFFCVKFVVIRGLRLTFLDGCRMLILVVYALSLIFPCPVQSLERWPGPLTAVGCERFQDEHQPSTVSTEVLVNGEMAFIAL